MVVRYFNTAGICEPDRHYMLPATARLPEARTLIAQGGPIRHLLGCLACHSLVQRGGPVGDERDRLILTSDRRHGEQETVVVRDVSRQRQRSVE